jgi:uncharacterized membrane protein YheB (UPF0754 family)
MKICFFLSPLILAFFGWFSVRLFLSLVFRWIIPSEEASIRRAVKQKLQELAESNGLFLKMQQLDLESEVNPLLDQRLNRLVDQLKGQVPMGEFLLTGSFAERLKLRAKDEILQILPEVKSRLIEKIQREYDPKEIIEEQVNRLKLADLEFFIKNDMKWPLRKLAALGAVVGYLLGFFEILLLHWFC